MKNEPLVSIVVGNYNGKKFLNTCLESVFKTKYPNFEVILVDDGSTDGSDVVAEKKYKKEKRLRIIRKEHAHSGAASTRNVGARSAQGEYIVFLDNGV